MPIRSLPAPRRCWVPPGYFFGGLDGRCPIVNLDPNTGIAHVAEGWKIDRRDDVAACSVRITIFIHVPGKHS